MHEERARPRAERQHEALEVLAGIHVGDELGDRDGRERRARPEALRAPLPVQRLEQGRIGERERVRRPVLGLDEREPCRREPPYRIRGRAGKVRVDDERVPVDGQHILLSDDIVRMDRLPRSLTVVGAGVIGVEYASMFAALGVRVTLLDKRERLLPFVDDRLPPAGQEPAAMRSTRQ